MKAAHERRPPAPSGGRLLAVGDVHGRFGELATALEALCHDPAIDRLVMLGDIVNKGPDSHLAGDWLHHDRVLGNHEDALSDLTASQIDAPSGQTAWLARVPGGERRHLIRRLGEAPVTIETTTPAGRRVGFVHGCVPFLDWTDATGILSDPAHPQHRALRRMALTSRDHARGVEAGTVGRVRGVDHVFLGHTPGWGPRSHGNTTLLDTGRCHAAPITVLDVDRWLDTITETAA